MACGDDMDGSRDIFLTSDDVRTGYITGVTFTAKPVQYAAVNGLAVFEGCIVLGTVSQMEQSAQALRSAVSSDAGALSDAEVVHGVGITGSQYRWPNATMPYSIDPSLPNQARVTNAIAHWRANTKMQFVERTAANAAAHPNFVHFIPSDGCWSQVGMQGNGRQDIGLASGCGTGAAIHEIGHAFGLWHEQSREDRGRFIRINWANIQAGKEHNFNQHITDGDDLGAYDFASIMHYSAYAFSKNNLPTIEALQSGVTFGNSNVLSAGDIAAVHMMYKLWYTATVNQTFSTSQPQNGWLNLSGLGWRKVNPGAADGVSNVMAIGARARAFGKQVSVVADGNFVYELSIL